MIAISDLHIGCNHSRSKEVLEFLQSQFQKVGPEGQPGRLDRLYLLGDIFDFYKWGRNWHFNSHDEDLLYYILSLSVSSKPSSMSSNGLTEGQPGVRVCYAPGNHDELFRQLLHPDIPGYITDFGNIYIANEFIYTSSEYPESSEGLPQATRYLMLHGDLFDSKRELSKHWYYLGDFLYDILLSLTKNLLPKTSKFPGKIKSRVKGVVKYINDYEQCLAKYAAAAGCQGVICGHIHTPIDKDIFVKPQNSLSLSSVDDYSDDLSLSHSLGHSLGLSEAQTIRYINCGSWITGEYLGAVVEEKGELQLLTF